MANVPVNIVYPIQGETYPASDPAAGSLSSLCVTASFSVTCSGGPHELEWGFDGSPTGRAQFYDMFSTEQVWKVAGGKHTFWVRADCGSDEVAFAVGT